MVTVVARHVIVSADTVEHFATCEIAYSISIRYGVSLSLFT